MVYNVQRICLNEGVPEPNIVSESGRAVMAHHSCIIMNVFGHIEIGSEEEIAAASVPDPYEPKVVREMREIVAAHGPRNRAEAYNDAAAKKEEALQMFKLGILGLEERAVVESLFWKLARGLADLNRGKKRLPRETRTSGTRSPTSTWRTSPSSRARPTAGPSTSSSPSCPCTGWTRRPPATPPSSTSPATRTGRLTASSRGRAWTRRSRSTRCGRRAVFPGSCLTGAYQDVMGDMHNLFGRVNEVHVFVDDEDPEDFYIEEVIPGDRIEQGALAHAVRTR